MPSNFVFRSRNCSLALSIAILPTVALGQQSAFQSANGETSLYLDKGSAATINFGDTKLSFGTLVSHSDTQKHPLLYGFELFASASTGTDTLFSSRIKAPEGGGDFVFGGHPGSNRSENSNTWLLLDVGYSRSSFYVSPTPESIDSAQRHFDRVRAVAAYNARLGDNFLVGIAVGMERRNNLTNLTQVTFETTTVAAPAGTTTDFVKTQAGYKGAYREYLAAPIYTDIVYVLPAAFHVPGFKENRLTIDGFTRSDLAVPYRGADGGLGLFLMKKGAPTKVLGGVTASWNDGKAKVALVASYTFGGAVE